MLGGKRTDFADTSQGNRQHISCMLHSSRDINAFAFRKTIINDKFTFNGCDIFHKCNCKHHKVYKKISLQGEAYQSRPKAKKSIIQKSSRIRSQGL